MDGPNKEVKELYTFKYGSEHNHIDLDTLITSQNHFSQALQEAKNIISPQSEFKIKVRALNPGSFQIDLMMNTMMIDPMTLWSIVEGAGVVLGLVVGVKELIIWLKGEKPEKVDKKGDVTIIHIDNRKIEVKTEIYNQYNTNVKLTQEIVKTYEVIDNDEDIDGVEIINDEGKEIFRADKTGIGYLSSGSYVPTLNSKTEIEKDVNLRVFKIVFGKGYKWEFYKKGRKIFAKIEDDTFMDQVDTGKPFAKGDILVSDIEITYKFDKGINDFVEHSFVLKKVKKHIPRNQQTELF